MFRKNARWRVCESHTQTEPVAGRLGALERMKIRLGSIVGLILLVGLAGIVIGLTRSNEPVSISFVGYTNEPKGITNALLKISNAQSRHIGFGFGQPEFLSSGKSWEKSTFEKSYPTFSTRAHHSETISLQVPAEGRGAKWRIPMTVIVRPNRADLLIERCLKFLRLPRPRQGGEPSYMLWTPELPPLRQSEESNRSNR